MLVVQKMVAFTKLKTVTYLLLYDYGFLKWAILDSNQ